MHSYVYALLHNFHANKKQNTSTGVAPDTISKRGSVKKLIQKSNWEGLWGTKLLDIPVKNSGMNPMTRLS